MIDVFRVYFAERKRIKMHHSRGASPLDRLWVVRLFAVSSTPSRASTKSSGRLDASRLSPDSALPWRLESKSETVPSCSVIRCIGRKAWREGQTRSTVEGECPHVLQRCVYIIIRRHPLTCLCAAHQCASSWKVESEQSAASVIWWGSCTNQSRAANEAAQSSCRVPTATADVSPAKELLRACIRSPRAH